MIDGMKGWTPNAFSYKENVSSLQKNNLNFRNRLIDSVINSDQNLNGKHVNLYMNCLVSQASGNGQELHMKYDESSTEENPVIYAWGKDSSGKEFETKIHVNDINPYHASPTEMKALHAHLAKQGGGVKSDSIPVDVSMTGYDANQKIDFVQYMEEWNVMQKLAKNPTADLGRSQLEQYLFFFRQESQKG